MGQAEAFGKTSDRLIQGVLSIWEMSGGAALSVRGLAQSVGAPASGIHYHFGSFEHLLVCAQQAALDRASLWCEAQLDDLPTLREGEHSLALIMALLIELWCQNERQLAFAWRECQQLAGRNGGAFLAVRDGWNDLWSNFWEEVCSRCGWRGVGRITSWLFDGESLLHMMSGDRLLDRACLNEMCRGWESWLSGELVPEGAWRTVARAEVAKPVDDAILSLSEMDEQSRHMAEIAADIVAEQGGNSLTHRAVASRAGVTLGTVSYRYRTISDLIRVAFEVIYSRLVPLDDGQLMSGAPNSMAERKKSFMREEMKRRGMMHILAFSELTLAVAKDDTLRHFARQLRYSRGRSAKLFLPEITCRPVSTLDAALYSGFVTGQQKSVLGCAPEAWKEGLDQTARIIGALVGENAKAGML